MVEYVPALDGVFHALADSTRREILVGLAGGERTVTEVAAPFDISLAAVSKHLRVLERAGLVRRTVEGRRHRIALSARPLGEAARWIDGYRRFWEERFDALADHLRENPDD